VIPVPTKNLILFLLAPLPFFIAGLFLFPFLLIAISLDVAILLIGLYDYFTALDSKDIHVSPGLVKVFSIGRKNTLSVTLSNTGQADMETEVRIGIPPFFRDLTEHAPAMIPKNGKTEYTFCLVPSRRGQYTLKNLYFRYRTRAGFFTISSNRALDQKVEVYPDVQELNRYMTMARRNRLADIGIHKNRYKGMGTEVEYLREYQKDDDAAHIDWKVTTRINRPVTRVYQMDTSNQVALVLDCGRMMVSEQKGLSTLDHAVNSVLMLSHVIFNLGDQIRIIAYSDKIISELPPTKGKDALKKVTRFVTRLEPEMVESNYRLVFEYLRKRLNKRSIVIFFTDMIDDINFNLFAKYLGFINRKHIALFILLKDTVLAENAEASPDNLDGFFTSTAAKEMYLRREEAIWKLKLKKINVIDTLPGQLTPRLIDKFMEIKSRNSR
jgi:uncharacterized protein (DUF58 family)